MTAIYARSLNGHENSNSLPSKRNFDTVVREDPRKRKPPLVSGGCVGNKISNSAYTEIKDGRLDTSILSGSPNLYKQNGEFMSEEGFIKIPRSLLVDPKWKGLRVKYQRLFLIILENTSYQHKNFSHNGESIKIKPGQFCISYRRLVELYNDGIKFKADRIDLSFIQRAVSTFSQLGFSIQETIHEISVITITYPDIYEHFKILSDTPFNTDSIRSRYTNEERKEEEEVVYVKGTNDNVSVFRSPLLQKKDEIEIGDEKIQEDFNVINFYLEQNGLCFKEDDLRKWIKKWTGIYVLEQIKMISRSKVKIDNPAAWIEKALKNDYAGQKKNIDENRKFAIKFKEENNWNDLHVTKKYCTLDRTGCDFQFAMSPYFFKQMLEEKFKNLH